MARFRFRRQYDNGTTADANPRTNPEDVDSKNLFFIPVNPNPNTGAEFGRLLLSAEGTPGDTIQVEVWAADDSTISRTQEFGTARFTNPSERRFYEMVGATTVTVGEIAAVTADNLVSGWCYLRRTGTGAANPIEVLVGAEG